jgi:hypothetical protein
LNNSLFLLGVEHIFDQTDIDLWRCFVSYVGRVASGGRYGCVGQMFRLIKSIFSLVRASYGMTIWLQRLNLGLLASVIAGLDPPIHLAEE